MRENLAHRAESTKEHRHKSSVRSNGATCFQACDAADNLRPQKTSACAKPGQRADDQCLDASLEGRMQDRSELRTMIDRQFVQLTRRPGLGINLGIVATHEPEHRRHLPCGAEATEILARRRGTGVFHPVGGEVAAKAA